jgi:hypothetical protein
MATRPAVPAPKPVLPSVGREVDEENENEDEVEEFDLSNGTDTGMLMPASVARGKVKAAKQDHGLDLFGLGESDLIACTYDFLFDIVLPPILLLSGERSPMMNDLGLTLSHSLCSCPRAILFILQTLPSQTHGDHLRSCRCRLCSPSANRP